MQRETALLQESAMYMEENCGCCKKKKKKHANVVLTMIFQAVSPASHVSPKTRGKDRKLLNTGCGV